MPYQGAPNTPKLDSRRGAPMGRRSILPDQARKALADLSTAWLLGMDDPAGEVRLKSCVALAAGAPVRVWLRRIPIDRSGYDAGGAYWGIPSNLWGAGSDCGGVDLWFRAADRAAARAHVLSLFPGARFFR